MSARRLAAIAPLSLAGCYLGAHGSIDAPVHRSSDAATAPQGHLELGLYYADQRQLGAVLLGVGRSPLVAAGADPEAPRVDVYSVGARYEHALSRRRPWLRGFGRVMLGGNPCSPARDAAAEEPDRGCSMVPQQRHIEVSSLALGVVLTGTGPPDADTVPVVASVGLAVVYTHASDAALGAADFLGLELSFALGGDVVTPYLRDIE